MNKIIKDINANLESLITMDSNTKAYRVKKNLVAELLRQKAVKEFKNNLKT